MKLTNRNWYLRNERGTLSWNTRRKEQSSRIVALSNLKSPWFRAQERQRRERRYNRPVSARNASIRPLSSLAPRFPSFTGFCGFRYFAVLHRGATNGGIRGIESGASESRYWIWPAPPIEFPGLGIISSCRNHPPSTPPSPSMHICYRRNIYFFFFFLFLFFSVYAMRKIVTRGILTYWNSPPFPFQIRRKSIFSSGWNARPLSGRYLLPSPHL